MKRLALAIVLALVLTGMSVAAPFLVSDPNPAGEGVTHYDLNLDGTTTRLATDPSGQFGLKADIAGISAGSHHAEIRAVRTDATFGETVSAWVPFDFGVPGAPGAPTGLRIVPN